MSAEIVHIPTWWCDDCATGSPDEMVGDNESDLEADAAEHNRRAHPQSDDSRREVEG